MSKPHYDLISLKSLIDMDPKELPSWYNKYRSNLIHLLENIDIDVIYGMPSYRILIPDEYKEFISLFNKLTPAFKHNSDSDEYMEE